MGAQVGVRAEIQRGGRPRTEKAAWVEEPAQGWGDPFWPETSEQWLGQRARGSTADGGRKESQAGASQATGTCAFTGWQREASRAPEQEVTGLKGEGPREDTCVIYC